MVYAQQMAEGGKLPELCVARRHLVDKLLVDLEATSALSEMWDQQWQFMKELASLVPITQYSATCSTWCSSVPSPG